MIACSSTSPENRGISRAVRGSLPRYSQSPIRTGSESRESLSSRRLFRQLKTVEREEVHAELVVDRHLPLEYLAAEFEHAGDVAAVLGFQSLDANGSEAVDHPDARTFQFVREEAKFSVSLIRRKLASGARRLVVDASRKRIVSLRILRA